MSSVGFDDLLFRHFCQTRHIRNPRLDGSVSSYPGVDDAAQRALSAISRLGGANELGRPAADKLRAVIHSLVLDAAGTLHSLQNTLHLSAERSTRLAARQLSVPVVRIPFSSARSSEVVAAGSPSKEVVERPGSPSSRTCSHSAGQGSGFPSVPKGRVPTSFGMELSQAAAVGCPLASAVRALRVRVPPINLYCGPDSVAASAFVGDVVAAHIRQVGAVLSVHGATLNALYSLRSAIEGVGAVDGGIAAASTPPASHVEGGGLGGRGAPQDAYNDDNALLGQWLAQASLSTPPLRDGPNGMSGEVRGSALQEGRGRSHQSLPHGVAVVCDSFVPRGALQCAASHRPVLDAVARLLLQTCVSVRGAVERGSECTQRAGHGLSWSSNLCSAPPVGESWAAGGWDGVLESVVRGGRTLVADLERDFQDAGLDSSRAARRPVSNSSLGLSIRKTSDLFRLLPSALDASLGAWPTRLAALQRGAGRAPKGLRRPSKQDGHVGDAGVSVQFGLPSVSAFGTHGGGADDINLSGLGVAAGRPAVRGVPSLSVCAALVRLFAVLSESKELRAASSAYASTYESPFLWGTVSSTLVSALTSRGVRLPLPATLSPRRLYQMCEFPTRKSLSATSAAGRDLVAPLLNAAGAHGEGIGAVQSETAAGSMLGVGRSPSISRSVWEVVVGALLNGVQKREGHVPPPPLEVSEGDWAVADDLEGGAAGPASHSDDSGRHTARFATLAPADMSARLGMLADSTACGAGHVAAAVAAASGFALVVATFPFPRPDIGAGRKGEAAVDALERTSPQVAFPQLAPSISPAGWDPHKLFTHDVSHPTVSVAGASVRTSRPPSRLLRTLCRWPANVGTAATSAVSSAFAAPELSSARAGIFSFVLRGADPSAPFGHCDALAWERVRASSWPRAVGGFPAEGPLVPMGRFVETGVAEGAYLDFGFVDAVVCPSAVLLGLVHPLGQAAYPRTFEVRGSRDGVSWTVLLRSEHDSTLTRDVPLAVWPLPEELSGVVGLSVTDGAASLSDARYYRYFRVVLTGPNSDGALTLQLSHFELFGTVATVGTPLQPQSRAPPPRPVGRYCGADVLAMPPLVAEGRKKLGMRRAPPARATR